MSLFLVSCADNYEFVCVPTKLIVTTGGCDASGYCGVQYEDGTFGVEHYPVASKMGERCESRRK